MDSKYRTIKALVFAHIRQVNGKANYATLTDEVKKHFPSSQWKKTHWAWYRYQILRGRFKNDFPGVIRDNLAQTGGRIPPVAPQEPIASEKPRAIRHGRGPQARDPEVKRIGDQVLDQVRFILTLAAKEDLDLRFRLNRWIFSRLMHDEIKIKRPIKKALWDSGIRRCQSCGETFHSLKGVEIHRKSGTSTYSIKNCELLCRDCHEQLS